MSPATTVSDIQVQRMRLRVAMSAVVGPATFDHTERVAVCNLAMAFFLMSVKRLIGIQLSQCAGGPILDGIRMGLECGVERSVRAIGNCQGQVGLSASHVGAPRHGDN